MPFSKTHHSNPNSPEDKPVMRKADLKVVMLGDLNVGKSSLVVRYLDRRFQDTVSTIGAAFLLKQWGHYNIAIWDTAGEEKYQGLNLFYCRNCSGAILVFDLCHRRSFETLRSRYLPLLESTEEFILKIIVGSKADLLTSNPRQVTLEEGRELARRANEKYCQTNEVPYFETSSRTGSNVDKVFETIFEHFFPNGGTKPRSKLSSNSLGFQQINIDGDSITLTKSNSDIAKNENGSCCV